MTSELYAKLSDRDKAFFDALAVLIKQQQRTNDLLEAILKA